MANSKIETEQRMKLLADLVKSIKYWSDKNPDYAEAYMVLLANFSSPQNNKE